MASEAAIPEGTILPWYSTKERPPTGWAFCDGREGRPNLNGRFLRGTDAPADNDWEDDVFGSNFLEAAQARRVARENDEGQGYYVVKAPGRSRGPFSLLPPHLVVRFIIKTSSQQSEAD